MYQLNIDNDKTLNVSSRKYTFSYAIDGTKENPIEATYAALAGCAGVYAFKACKKINLSPIGIKIYGKPYMDRNNPLMLSKWITTIVFPKNWGTSDEKNFVLDEIKKCAVKEMISNGFKIDFETLESAPLEQDAESFS